MITGYYTILATAESRCANSMPMLLLIILEKVEGTILCPAPYGCATAILDGASRMFSVHSITHYTHTQVIGGPVACKRSKTRSHIYMNHAIQHHKDKETKQTGIIQLNSQSNR